MQLTYDGLYHYWGYHGCPSRCWLRIYKAPGQAVVVATELADNPGTSITNMAEVLATHVCQEFGLPLDDLMWIEHYPERCFLGGRPRLPASFDHVTFAALTAQGLQRPEWRRLSQAQVETLIEQALTPGVWEGR